MLMAKAKKEDGPVLKHTYPRRVKVLFVKLETIEIDQALDHVMDEELEAQFAIVNKGLQGERKDRSGTVVGSVLAVQSIIVDPMFGLPSREKMRKLMSEAKK